MEFENRFVDIQQTYFEWPVSKEGYYWDNKAKPSRGRPYLVPNPDTSILETKKILEIRPQLFLDFAEVEATTDGIADFAREYGMLGKRDLYVTTINYSHREDEPKPKLICAESWSRKRGKRIYFDVGAETFKDWKDEIQEMRWIVQLWEWVRTSDIEALGHVIHWTHEGNIGYVLADREVLMRYSGSRELFQCIEDTLRTHGERPTFEYYWGYSEPPSTDSRLFDYVRDNEILAPARVLLNSMVSRKFRRFEVKVRPQLFIGSDLETVPYFVPDNLLSAMWLELYLAISGQRHWKRCEICGAWEDVTKRSKNWNKHQSCATKRRVERYRERQKALSGQK